MNKNFIESMAGMAVKEAFAKATGPVPYTMTNLDFELFRNSRSFTPHISF